MGSVSVGSIAEFLVNAIVDQITPASVAELLTNGSSKAETLPA